VSVSPRRRRYESPKRDSGAEATRRRIVDAARGLLVEKGYSGATVAAIAQAAGVAPQTVYASFGSKRRILAEIIDQAAFGPDYEELVGQLRTAPNGSSRLRAAARIARQNHRSRQAEIDLTRGAGAISPELARLERSVEERRQARTARLIDFLVEHGELRPGLDRGEAHDLLWALTGSDLYRQLVLERGWPAERYEVVLTGLLVHALLGAESADRGERAD
jgi:TetR/AcrR family transcriptional regulator, regulator of cefoperazone and chloramphenicol sensitivity